MNTGRSGCIASAARASSKSFNAATKNDVSWPFLKRLRDLGRNDAKEWLEENFDKIGVESTLDIEPGSAARPRGGADEGRAGDGLIGWRASALTGS